jgi:hypothetical protein
MFGGGTGVFVDVAVGSGVAVAGGTQICSKGTSGGGASSPQLQPSTAPFCTRRASDPNVEYDH